MPQAVVAIATAVSAAAANAAAVTGSSLVIETVSSLTYSAAALGVTTGALYGIGVALAPKIPTYELTTPLKQAMTFRQSGTGTVRVAGAYALFTTGSSHPNFSYDVMAQLDGESDGWVAHFLNDDLMAPIGAYWYAPGASGKYGGGGSNAPNLVKIDHRLGLATETAYAISADVPTWDASHRGDGVTSALLTCIQAKREDQPGDFPNGLPSLSSVYRAQKLFDPRDGAQTQGTKSTYKWTDNSVIGLLAYLTDANGGMGLDYARFLAPSIAQTEAAANECDGLITTSGMHATLLDAAAAGDHKIFLADTTGLTVGATVQLATENIVVSALGAGGEVDFTSPAALAFAHPQGELEYWNATGQQARYRCNALYGHDTAPGDVIKSYLSTFDGWIGQRGDGAVMIRTNTIYDPTVVLTDRHIVGWQVQNFLPDEQAINQYIVSYTDPASAYNKADAGYVEDDNDIAARGEARNQELYLQWVPSAPQAVAVARAMLARATQTVRGTITCNLAGLAVMGERYVRLQISEQPLVSDTIVEVTGKVSIDLQNMTVSFPFVVASRVVLGSVQERVQEAVAQGSLTATLPAPPTEGNWLVALGMLGWANANSPPGAPPTAAAGWTVLDAHTAATAHAADPSCAVAYRRVASGVSATQTPFTNGSNSRYSVAMIEVSGIGDDFTSVLSSHALGVPATETGASTVALTTTASNPSTLAIALGAWYGGGAGSGSITLSGSSWTHTVNTGSGVGVAIAGSLTAGVAESVMATYHEVTFTNAYGLCGALLTFGGDGISSTPGSSYTLPPLAPPSGAPLQPLAVPTITSVTPSYPSSGGGVTGATLSIVVVDPGVTATWKVQYKLHTDSVWTAATDNAAASGSPLTIVTGLIPATGSIDVQVAYITPTQVSPWSATTTITVAAATAVVTDTATATEALSAGNVCNLYTASGAAKVQKANATDLTKPANGFVLASVASGGSATVYMPGQYITGLTSLTPGATYYLSTTGGASTTICPSSAGNGAQEVGVADSTGTKLFFNPKPMTGV